MDFLKKLSVSGDVRVMWNSLASHAQGDITFFICRALLKRKHFHLSADVQSAKLTVRETIRFSAQLWLDKSNPVYNELNGLEEHINFIIDTLELTAEADTLVGNEEEGGLTFEQKKRLSIAVEIAASPSIIFLVSHQ